MTLFGAGKGVPPPFLRNEANFPECLMVWIGLMDSRLAVQVCHFDTWLRFAGNGFVRPAGGFVWACRGRFWGRFVVTEMAIELHALLAGIGGESAEFRVGSGAPSFVTPQPMVRVLANDRFAEVEASLTDRLDVGLIVSTGLIG